MTSSTSTAYRTDQPIYKEPKCYLLLLAIGCIVGVGFLFKYLTDDANDNPYVSYTFDVDFLEVKNIRRNQPGEGQLRLNLTVTTQLHAEYFRTLNVTVEYDDQLVSNTTIAPFYQDPLFEKTIPVQMDMADKKLPSEGVLEFTVIVHGDYREVSHIYGIGVSCDMMMVCKGVNVTLSSSNNTWKGSTKDGPFPCKYSTKGWHMDS